MVLISNSNASCESMLIGEQQIINSEVDALLINHGFNTEFIRSIKLYPELIKAIVQQINKDQLRSHQLQKSPYYQPPMSNVDLEMVTVVRGIKLKRLKDFKINGGLFLGSENIDGAIDAADLTEQQSIEESFASPSQNFPIGVLITFSFPKEILAESRSEDWIIRSFKLLQNGITDLGPYIVSVKIFN